jgi:hypothetical protein
MLVVCSWTVYTTVQFGPSPLPGSFCGGTGEWSSVTTYAWRWTDWDYSEDYPQWRQNRYGYLDEERLKVHLFWWTVGWMLAFLAAPRMWRRNSGDVGLVAAGGEVTVPLGP